VTACTNQLYPVFYIVHLWSQDRRDKSRKENTAFIAIIISPQLVRSQAQYSTVQ